MRFCHPYLVVIVKVRRTILCSYILIGKEHSAQENRIGVKKEYRENVMSKHMSLIVP